MKGNWLNWNMRGTIVTYALPAVNASRKYPRRITNIKPSALKEERLHVPIPSPIEVIINSFFLYVIKYFSIDTIEVSLLNWNRRVTFIRIDFRSNPRDSPKLSYYHRGCTVYQRNSYIYFAYVLSCCENVRGQDAFIVFELLGLGLKTGNGSRDVLSQRYREMNDQLSIGFLGHRILPTTINYSPEPIVN